MHDAVLVVDENGTVLDLSKSAQFLLGRTYQDSVGQPLKTVSSVVYSLCRSLEPVRSAVAGHDTHQG